MIKPKRLKKGDTIAIIALSWGGHSVFPHVVEKGIERLQEFGFNVVRGDTFNHSAQEIYEDPKIRAGDIHKQFLDLNVDGIIALIGGDEGVRVLPYLDMELIKQNFKFFMGYSDTTVYNSYFNKHGLVTFNGPAVMVGFAESLKLEEDFVEFFEHFVFGTWESFEYRPFKRYTNIGLDWNNPENLNRENMNYKINNENWKIIQGEGVVQGELFGGCIEVLEFLKGTDFWPQKDFWRGKILFFETSEDKPLPQQVKYMLRNYGSQGILQEINGILFGRARDYSDEEKVELEEVIVQVCKEFKREDLVVMTNLDFGHTAPQFILPLGIKAQIDTTKKSLKLLESIWRE